MVMARVSKESFRSLRPTAKAGRVVRIFNLAKMLVYLRIRIGEYYIYIRHIWWPLACRLFIIFFFHPVGLCRFSIALLAASIFESDGTSSDGKVLRLTGFTRRYRHTYIHLWTSRARVKTIKRQQVLSIVCTALVLQQSLDETKAGTRKRELMFTSDETEFHVLYTCVITRDLCKREVIVVEVLEE